MKENLKELKKDTKLNLSSTWTKKKMVSLFLMSWLSVNGVEAGQNFKDCLGNFHNWYNSLLSFPFSSNDDINNNRVLRLCCDETQCSVIPPFCVDTHFFQCVKISQTIYCEWICGGIVGDTPITTNTTLGVCPNSIDNVADYLKSTAPNTEHLECADDSPCKDLECFLDNNGWTCAPSSHWKTGIGAENCFLQWTTLIGKSPISTVSTATNTIVSNTENPTNSITSTSSSIITPSQDPHLVEKIAIPVGVIVGTVTIGGITYLIYKKGKNKILLISGNGENENIEEIELTSPIKGLPNLPTQDSNSEQKEDELSQLIQQTKNKIGSDLEIALETLLDTQDEIIKGNNTYAIRKDQREAKEKLLIKLSLEEINKLLQLQGEVTQEKQEQELQAQIEVNPYGQEVRNLGRE